MTSSSADSAQELTYPPVRINHSLTKLDLETLMMRSTTSRVPEEAGSALEDSSYDLLADSTDSLLETSDDEAHTESIASTDGPTTDDASNFTDEDDEDDEDNDYGRADTALDYSITSTHDSNAVEQYDSRPTYSTGDSTMTEVPAKTGGGEDARWIKLDEQPAEEPGVMYGATVFKSYPDETGFSWPVLDQYHCSEVRLVVKAALSQEPMPPPDSYRILFIGMPDEWEEGVITSKIRAALTAYPRTSSSVTVQGELKPYEPVIHAYRCTEFQTFKHEEQCSIAIILDDGKQLTLGPGHASASAARPDLVVFCHPTTPGPAAYAPEFAPAREVFDFEKMPCLDMVQAPQYGKGVPSYDFKSLSVCAEGRNDPYADYELIEVLPLHYSTFNVLEPSQINRHLALISPHLSVPPAPVGKDPRIRRLCNTSKTYMKKLREARPAPASMLFVLIALTGIISAYFLGPVLISTLLEQRSNLDVQPSVVAPVSVSTSTAASFAVTPQPIVSVSSPPPIRSVARDLTVVPPQPKPRTQEKKDKFIGFGIQKTADHQFTLNPHKDFINIRKKPQLQIQVSREWKAVPIRYNRTISGVYIVDIEQQYPFGNFNVSIASYSKPLLQQSFEIALGHNKSTLAQLLETSHEWTTLSMPSHLLALTAKPWGEWLANLTDVDVTVRTWTNGARESGGNIAAHFQTAKEEFGRRLNAKTRFVKEIPGAAWLGVRKATAPIRTSESMLRARMNALRIRCKMETAAGLSSGDGSGKQTWACAKVMKHS